MNSQMARVYEGAAAALKHAVTPTALASAINEAPQVINNWERRGPSSKGLLAFQRELGINATWVITGTGQPLLDTGPTARQREPGYVDLPAALTTAERDLVLAFRTITKRRQVAVLAELMAEAQQQLADMQELNARTGAKGPVSSARAAETLPVRPDGEQPDTEPGRL
jgi:hypothetical protein